MSICGWLSMRGDFEGSFRNEEDRLTTAEIASRMVSISEGSLFDEYLRYTSRVGMTVTAEEYLLQTGYVRIDTDRKRVLYSEYGMSDAQHCFVNDLGIEVA